MHAIVRTSTPDFELVKQLAWRVLEENSIVTPPINAAALAKTYGIEAFEAVFNPGYDHIAGFINFEANKILVNAKEHHARKNFTIAHELGHLLLGHNKENGYTVLLRNPDPRYKTPVEQEANVFAANVLVPTPFLQEWLNRYTFATDKQLAKVFGVSEEVIHYRRLYLR